MNFYQAMNPKTSLLISFISGMGLLAIVTFAPTKSEINQLSTDPFRDEDLPKKENDSSPLSNSTNSDRDSFKERIESERNPSSSSPKLLNMRITPEDLKNFQPNKDPIKQSLGAWGYKKRDLFRIQNFRTDRVDGRFRGSIDRRDLSFNKDDFNVDTGISQQNYQPWNENHFSSWGKYNRAGFRGFGQSSPNLDYLDINIPLSQSVSAVFSASSHDVFDDRSREANMRSYALAGISLNKGEFLSTRFLAGDRNLNLHGQNANPGMAGATAVQDFRRMGFGERESLDMRTIEWQTNIQASKSVRLQTAIYNQSNATLISSGSQRTGNVPDSGRMSLFLGEKNIILNVKYDYQMTDIGRRNILTEWQPNRDAASLGFIVFLDPSQNYSLYLGGNQFNVSQRYQGNRGSQGNQNSMPPSFTASFRGKAKGQESSNFFVNFQNQPPGAWGLGMPGGNLGTRENPDSKSFYEYATTLGLEVNF